LNSKYVLSQLYEQEDIKEVLIHPSKTEAINDDTLYVETAGISGQGYVAAPDYVHTQNTLDTE
jgi:hypothetical protein